jgi:DNA topoisomerase-2
MYLLTVSGNIKKYESPEEILIEYAKVRLGHYKLRKRYLVEKITKELDILDTRARFIEHVVEGRIEIFRKSKAQIQQYMKTFAISEAHWDVCFSVKTYQYTTEEIEKLNKEMLECRKKRDTIQQTQIVDMWKNDLELL